jgi:hypothetical protein
MWWTHRAQRVWETEAWETSVDTTAIATVVHLATQALWSTSTNDAFLLLPSSDAGHARRCSDAYEQPPSGTSTFGEILHKHDIGSRHLHGCVGMPSGRNYVVYG